MYQSVLRAELTHRYGVAFTEIVQGQAEIAGVPGELLARFSKRTAEVDQALTTKVAEFYRREGRDPSRFERAALGREAAADTRAHKTGNGVPDLTARWLSEAADVGVTPENLMASIAEAGRSPAPPVQVTVGEIIEEPSGSKSTWHRLDVLRTVCDQVRPQPGANGQRWVGLLDRAVDKVLDQCIDLDPALDQHAMRRVSDGRSMWIEPAASHVTSEVVLAQEEAILTWALDAQTAEPSQSPKVHRGGLDVLQADARNMYATDAEPLGPVLIVESTTDPNQATDIGALLFPNALGYEELELDGRRAALATLPDNAKGLYVEINSAWVSIWSRGVSDEALRGLGRTLTADAAGHYDVAASALPDGMHKIDMAALRGRDYVSIDYAPSNNDGTSMYLSIAPAAATPLGRGEFVYEFKAVSVDGFSGFLGSRPTGDATTPTTDRLLLWRRDGLDFLLSGRGVTGDQMLAAATSASPAAPDEWAHLLDQGNAASNDTIATGTAPPAAPADTEPAFVGAARDRPITVTIDDVSNTEQQWSGVLPTGQPWSAKVTRVYDHIEMRSYSSDGTVLASLEGSIDQLIGGGQVTCCSPMAITKNPNGTAMRVLLPNGDRYTIPLHDLPGTDGVRIAFIPIPDLAPLTELVDANGNVLESYVPH